MKPNADEPIQITQEDDDILDGVWARFAQRQKLNRLRTVSRETYTPSDIAAEIKSDLITRDRRTER